MLNSFSSVTYTFSTEASKAAIKFLQKAERADIVRVHWRAFLIEPAPRVYEYHGAVPELQKSLKWLELVSWKPELLETISMQRFCSASIHLGS